MTCARGQQTGDYPRAPICSRDPPWPWPICPIFWRPTPILSEAGNSLLSGPSLCCPRVATLLPAPSIRRATGSTWCSWLSVCGVHGAGGGTWSGCQRRWNFRSLVLRPALWDVLAGDTDALLFKPPNVPPPTPFHPKYQISELQNPSTQSLGLTFAEHPLCARHLTCGIS